ncbi:MAG: HAMP domain-containing sensor histidine kinase, partial [Cyclobacteriaceae bacterium]|nr:HAMP domain-containing sensor histidine kinase [Cyclobacteriaceae bacterium]
LSSMLGLIEIAQRTDDPEEIKMCFGMMRGRIKILDDFIREIIDYSRNARLELNKDKFCLLELTKEVVDGLKYAEDFESISIKYSMPTGLEVETDQARLRVVLSNLIDNSLKYHDPAKENPKLEIFANSSGNQLRIKVQDNGLGISEEYQPNIFEMFYRASENSKGAGLGLYIVNETIKKLNGTIKVTSKIGHGSTFEVVIPLSK